MKLHILGICGTFMGGLALLARELGHDVSGTDANTYPPMSDQLRRSGIRLHEGYSPRSFDERPDLVIVGNALSRGNPCVEYMLDAALPYVSGPEWLREAAFPRRHVLAVAGTHGKSTTSSMLAWILAHAGLEPGFLIGAVPGNFGQSARLAGGMPFVIEADEYDCAFFDKRAKFQHYRPQTVILNNIEFDHADIYPDLAAIRREFHHFVRTVPGTGLIVANGMDAEVRRTLSMGCWTPVQYFGAEDGDWRLASAAEDYSSFLVRAPGSAQPVEIRWESMGVHNALNAIAAMAAARAVGVEPAAAAAALGEFRGVVRRLQQLGVRGGVTVYDDFAHHPTAIRVTIEALRRRVGSRRILAVMEPRSNTMKMGVHAGELGAAFAGADMAFMLRPPGLSWDLEAALTGSATPCAVLDSVDGLLEVLVEQCREGDHVLIMSNGSFAGLHGRLLERLQ